MSWASSLFPSTNHSVLTSSSRRALNVRNRSSAEVSPTDAPAFARSHTLVTGLLIPSTLQTRDVRRRIAANKKIAAFTLPAKVRLYKEQQARVKAQRRKDDKKVVNYYFFVV